MLRWRHKIGIGLWRWPRIYLPIIHVSDIIGGGYDTGIVDSDTDIVVEGFPRSANTYTVEALRLAHEREGRPIKIAHHIHSPVQVLQGIKLGIPCLVLIRSPLDALSSYLLRAPEFTPQDVVEEYIRFHEPLLDVKNKVVLASFEQVISELPSVIDSVNRIFGSSFSNFSRGLVPDGEIQNRIINKNKSNEGGKLSKIAIPSKGKEALRDHARDKIESEAMDEPIRQANEIYEKLMEGVV